MIATPASARTSGRSHHGDSLREAWLFAAGAGVDTVATALLLAGSADAPGVAVLAAASLHAMAALPVLGLTRLGGSRRWLSLAAAFCVPLVGTAVAIAATVTTGRGRIVRRRRRIFRRRPAVALAEARRVRDALPLWEALTGDDHEQRHAALRELSRRDDAEAIAMARRAVVADDPDLALSAALALDEISERVERSLLVRNAWSVRDAAG